MAVLATAGLFAWLPPGQAAPDAPPPAPLRTPFLGPDGQVRLLLTPEFRDATSLFQELGLFAIDGLGVDLTGPMVANPNPRKPPLPSRLLLRGPPKAVNLGRRVLGYLDVPVPSVRLTLLAAEIVCNRDDQRGGSVTFDRDRGTAPSNALLRGLSSQFDPDSYLRASLIDVRGLPGTTLTFGNSGQGALEEGPFRMVLRMLAERGEAEILTRPTLVVTEGIPGSVSSLVDVPEAEIERVQPGYVPVGLATQSTGVLFEVLADHIGTDDVSLDVNAIFRFLLPDATDPAAAGTTKLRQRQVRTRLTLHDRETVLLGGLEVRRQLGSRRGLPILSGMPGVTGVSSGTETTELVIFLEAEILTPGRGAVTCLPPGEARRLRRLER